LSDLRRRALADPLRARELLRREGTRLDLEWWETTGQYMKGY